MPKVGHCMKSTLWCPALLHLRDIYVYVEFGYGIRLWDIGYKFPIFNCTLDRVLKQLYM